MTHILCIDTATPVCSIALVRDNEVLYSRESSKKNSHSEIVTIFIDEVIKEANLKYTDLDAVAVSKGPGSYTGLRIGVSTAKGLCFALDIPLVSVNTLRSMAFGMAQNYDQKEDASLLFCPMIDARRMEVYTAIFNGRNEPIEETKAEIIDKDSFSSYLDKNKIIFFGDGAMKCKDVITHKNAVFIDSIYPSAGNMAEIVFNKFQENQFEDVAYFEPFYLKEFIAGKPKVKGLE